MLHCSNQSDVAPLTKVPALEGSLVYDFQRSAALRGLQGFGMADAIESFHAGRSAAGATDSRLHETPSFGSNPGQLRMFSYTPTQSAGPLALVVVLHGCGQSAIGYDRGAGWSAMGDRYGFAVLMPEQQRTNNPNGCFNWFEPGDTQRGRGEAASIHQMVESMLRDGSVDPRRVFVTGLSAGGAMTSVMLACYPDTFAAGAVIAGLPYGAASNVQQALTSMYQCPPQPAKHWGDLVRAAAPPHVQSWPRVSVWHGGADKTVVPCNARETVKQWTDVHGLTDAPSMEDKVQGYPRQVWLNGIGEEVVESYTIPHMAHGTPLAPGDAGSECGAPGPFLLDVGISSSFHIAQFFGLTPEGVQAAKSAINTVAGKSTRPLQPSDIHSHRSTDAIKSKTGSRTDIGAVISAALAKAGLLIRS